MPVLSMPHVETSTQYFAFDGGLDQVTPAIRMQAGRLLAVQNYEPTIDGGYARIGGYERYDGRTAPSSASYTAVACTLTSVPAAGASVTIGAATCLFVEQTADKVGMIVTGLVGSIPASTAITVSAVQVGTTAALSAYTAAIDAATDATYTADASDVYRALIGQPTGSGAIRGVVLYNGIVYCFRDNSGGTAGQMWKATATGWTQVALGRELTFTTASKTVTMTIAAPGVVTYTAHGLAVNQAVVFTTTGALPTGVTAGTTYYVSVVVDANNFRIAATVGGADITTSGTQSGTHTCTITPAQVSVGDTVTGASSGATGVVTASCLKTGAWGAAPTGTLIFATVTGAFTTGESLRVSSNAKLGAAAGDTAITLTAGGTYAFDIYNMGGQVTTTKLYGANGLDRCFEFDGTTFVPINTGATSDKPAYIVGHRHYLCIGMGSSVMNSSVGNAYRWVASEGATETPTGDTITGLVRMAGEVLGIFCRNSSFALTGTGPNTWSLQVIRADVGAVPHSVVSMTDPYMLDDRGIVNITTTQAYGNFVAGTLSRAIQPTIDSIRGTVVGAYARRQRNQYVLLCSDGTVVYMRATLGNNWYVTQNNPPVFTTGSLSITPNCVWSGEDSTGVERVFVGAADGYVYEMNKGSSFDGAAIQSFAKIWFNHNSSPRVRKRYRLAILEMTAVTYAALSFSADFAYGDPDISAHDTLALVEPGAGGYWNISNWNQVTWNAQDVSQPRLEIEGTAVNIALTFLSNSRIDQGHTLQGVNLHYTLRRQQR